jgi:hypothetical protein
MSTSTSVELVDLMALVSRPPGTVVLIALADGPHTLAKFEERIGDDHLAEQLVRLHENGIIALHGDLWSLSQWVSLISTTEKHVFAFQFPHGGFLQLALDPVPGSRKPA